jgi:hypothetical protein
MRALRAEALPAIVPANIFLRWLGSSSRQKTTAQNPTLVQMQTNIMQYDGMCGHVYVADRVGLEPAHLPEL